MREEGAGSRAPERGGKNVKSELQGKDPENRNALGKLSGQACITLLSNWISEQFHVAFVPKELQHSPSAQSQDGQD